MKPALNIRLFAHSWVSDWNHGNAHFLRGLARSLVALGHNVRCYEQLGSWSLTNLVRTEGQAAIAAIDEFHHAFPQLDVRFYNDDANFREFALRELRHSDVVIIHEWTDPVVANTILSLKKQCGFVALFHDTHHRAYTSPAEVLRFHLHLFDGVLAFGDALRRIYVEGFGIPRAWTFHEAADVQNFTPRERAKVNDVIWIGNWGDEERTRELEEFLIGPAAALHGASVAVHGVRYPEEAIERLRKAGVEYRGYLPNLRGPEVYGASHLTLHVPRRQYTNGLSGIPTIRVFEALACGIPLVCSPWQDAEGLFRPGEDYVIVENGAAMKAEIEHLLRDAAARRQLAASGLESIRNRHTCMHRAEQLIEICGEFAQ
jgi:spore maturation protein CgeB